MEKKFHSNSGRFRSDSTIIFNLILNELHLLRYKFWSSCSLNPPVLLPNCMQSCMESHASILHLYLQVTIYIYIVLISRQREANDQQADAEFSLCSHFLSSFASFLHVLPKLFFPYSHSFNLSILNKMQTYYFAIVN